MRAHIAAVTSVLECFLHQVRRLDAAIRKEEKDALSAAADADGVDDENKRKRKRRGDGEDEENAGASLDAEKLEGMGYRELQALAKARGLAANGSKKEVIERLLSAPGNVVAVADGGVEDKSKVAKGGNGRVEEVKMEKMVTVTKKGAAVLDQHIPDNIKMTYHVLQVGDEIYDATLNQTNVGNNNNKFYIIQALGILSERKSEEKL